jgi:hypothetical protein
VRRRAIGSGRRDALAQQLAVLRQAEEPVGFGHLLERCGMLRAARFVRFHEAATLELFRTRAETIVYQMRDIHGQSLADPGMNVHAFLEDLLEKQELMADPLGDLEADRAVRELLAGVQPAAEPRAQPLKPKPLAAHGGKLKC